MSSTVVVVVMKIARLIYVKSRIYGVLFYIHFHYANLHLKRPPQLCGSSFLLPSWYRVHS